MSPRRLARGLPVLVALLVASPSPAAASFVTFESGIAFESTACTWILADSC